MQYDGAVKEIFGGEVETTNNRMEIMAVIRTLENLIEPYRDWDDKLAYEMEG